MRTPKQTKIETIIDGSDDQNIINAAVAAYLDALDRMAFPDDLDKSLHLKNAHTLHTSFTVRTDYISTLTAEIMLQINRRAKLLVSDTYVQLKNKDASLWRLPNKSNPLFGVLACVDKGIPAEAVVGPELATLGRVLAGDINITYIPSKRTFVPVANALIKRFIHYGRQGNKMLVEPLIEHTTCGRRGQILANERGQGDIPSLGFIFDHIEALESEFTGTKSIKIKKLEHVQKLWLSLDRHGLAVVTPDAGLYSGVVQKIAQRQALKTLHEDITIISPIEVYEKETGNVYMGLDALHVLTHPAVLRAKGYTKDILAKLAREKTIFSLESWTPNVFLAIAKHTAIQKGSKTFADLQSSWIGLQQDLVDITAVCWKLYMKKSSPIRSMVDAYFKAWNNTSSNPSSATDRCVIHHLFHMTAYAYLLDTLNRGNEPGKHHIEHYLATGDHEIGTKKLIALGQGDLDRPSASQIFTGYSVLLHSSPGHDGTPIPVLIKLDTDRRADQPMSTEETNVAFDDMREFFKLWPYFLVGDMIPILMVRGKHMGGISRLGLSIIRSFGDMTQLYEQTGSPLPQFVPANTSKGEVVLVPATDVLSAGIEAGNDLTRFRAHVIAVADRYSNPTVQEAFTA